MLSMPGIEKTKFTEWLETNKQNEDARTLTYVEFPKHWVWNSKGKLWTRRKKGKEVDRIYFAHPSSGERFYMRMLLNFVKWSISFECIRTVNGVTYPTFKAACYALGLLDDDREWVDCLSKAAVWATGKLFFISGHGGIRKTFLWNTIASKLRSDSMIVLPVATSGIASLLLPNGQTAHSQFRIPLDVTAESTCEIKHGTQLAELLQKTSLIIWDEAPMTHKYCFEALDKSLRDILSTQYEDSRSKPFGGLTVVCGGDFRHILPVIPQGEGADC
ncbi:uncharacterized protein LOC141686186 [Apium graveolens]|uniref:uncharacterized protein LOC141686186 n=1 Tax=Apium graveolens TaxID=4045 RepID=UPI003D79FBE7